MKRNWKKILIAILVIGFVTGEAMTIKKPAFELDHSKDFLELEDVPENIAVIVKATCYDCHSYEVKYPWYNYVFPISWWTDNHIEHGREHLNFSIWGTYDLKRKAHKAEECADEVGEGHMPIASYNWMHPEGRLSDEERNAFADFFLKLEKSY